MSEAETSVAGGAAGVLQLAAEFVQLAAAVGHRDRARSSRKPPGCPVPAALPGRVDLPLEFLDVGPGVGGQADGIRVVLLADKPFVQHYGRLDGLLVYPFRHGKHPWEEKRACQHGNCHAGRPQVTRSAATRRRLRSWWA